MAAQYRIGTFDNFNLNIRSFVVPQISDAQVIEGDIKLNFQFRISDDIYLPTTSEKENDIKSDLVIELNFKWGSSDIYEEVSLSKGEFIE